MKATVAVAPLLLAATLVTPAYGLRAASAVYRPIPAAASRRSYSPRLAALDLLSDPELLPPPDAVVSAVEATYARQPAGTRLTAADLAAQSGIGIDEARLGMKDLAAALAGADGLSVSASSKGDLLYTFPSDVRGELASRSTAAKARDAWNSAKPVLQTVGRFSFGVALFASIAIIFTAITVITSGGSDERDRDDRGFGGERRGGGMFGGGMFGGPFGGFGFGYGYSPLDLLFPPPWGFYRYGWFSPPPKMSLPEAIYSFVFGDGDPNTALRAARVRAMAEVIRSNGGAVVAENLAPFLDPPTTPAQSAASNIVDESWVLPAVTELGGRPEVNEDGTIVYVFDDLTVSSLASEADLVLADPALAGVGSLTAEKLAELASKRQISTSGADAASLRDALRKWAGDTLSSSSLQRGGSGKSTLFPDGYLEERTAPFSNADNGQQIAAGVLGLINFGGAAYLANLLSQVPPGVRLPDELGLVQDILPFLLAYAVSYIAIPAARFVKLQASNADIEQRNTNRRAWRDALRQPTDALRRRIGASSQSKRSIRVVGEEEVEFDSAKGLGEQAVEQTPGLDDFDRRLKEAANEGQ